MYLFRNVVMIAVNWSANIIVIASVVMNSYDDEVQAGMDSGGSEHHIFYYFLLWEE